MSRSLHVVGFRSADDTWNKMKAIWDACKELSMDPPAKVVSFFDGEYPGSNPGMEVNIKTAIKEVGGSYWSGFEVDLQALPEGVRHIRAYIS